MAKAKDWARAFAKQAVADFNTWNALQLYLRLPEGEPSVPMGNCEYPWEDAKGRLRVPAETTFSILNQLLADGAGRMFLKLVRESALSLLR